MTRIGYARVSTVDQDTTGQRDALTAAGCVRIFEDVASGARSNRPQLAAALDYLNPGDELVVWKLDRLGRSLPHLIETVDQLGRRGVQFVSLTEAIDTTTPTGRLLFSIAGAFAEFERDLVRERTQVGLRAARQAGRKGGRPQAASEAQIAAARMLIESGSTQANAAATVGISLRTLTRRLAGPRAE
jgi:DNA invertase Pin-like site-specific DNA recombinase